MMTDEMHIPIRSESDIVLARQNGRSIAVAAGFSGSDLTVIATAISEVARNIVTYAKKGEIQISPVSDMGKTGLLIIASDEGPGIADISLALQDGYSTSRSLGLGLPGVRRLMDEFSIDSEVGKGTTVTLKKWKR
jgi:serine/threonine-protein kinase RsbT